VLPTGKGSGNRNVDLDQCHVVTRGEEADEAEVDERSDSDEVENVVDLIRLGEAEEPPETSNVAVFTGPIKDGSLDRLVDVLQGAMKYNVSLSNCSV
jgi:hypothetical protein